MMTIKDCIINICKSVGKVSISDILKYVRNNGWFEKDLSIDIDDDDQISIGKIQKFIRDGIDTITESEEQENTEE
jgi:hypothetical protein